MRTNPFVFTLHDHTNSYGTENRVGHSFHFVLSQVKETWNKTEVKQTKLLFIAKYKGCPKCGSTNNLLSLALCIVSYIINLNNSYGPSKLSVYNHAFDSSSKLSFIGFIFAPPEKEFRCPVFIIVTCRLKKSYMQGENGKAISFLNEMLSENLYGEY